MEFLYLIHAKATRAIVALALVVFGVLALAWPAVGITLFAVAFAAFAAVAAVYALFQTARAAGNAVPPGRPHPEVDERLPGAAPAPDLRVTLTRETEDATTPRF